MPRDTRAPAEAAPWVLPIHAARPLQFRVRGLRGSRSLGDWIERTFGTERVRASSATGVVRIVDPSERDAATWSTRLTDAVSAFAPVPRTVARRERDISENSPTAQQASIFKSDLHAVALTGLLKRVESNPTGLTSTAATARLKRDGRNEITDVAGRTDSEILLDQFKSLPVALLAASGAVSVATRAFADAGAIGVVLAANGGIGFWTERRAEQTVDSLRKLAPASALVQRDGEHAKCQRPSGVHVRTSPCLPVAADARVSRRTGCRLMNRP